MPASAEPPMIWLQGNAMENPILPASSPSHTSAAAGSSHLKAPATHNNNSNLVANSYLQPEECLKFLAEGFDELLKCRSVRIHTVLTYISIILSNSRHKVLMLLLNFFCFQFLQWSYPYSYFEFSDSEDGSSRYH